MLDSYTVAMCTDSWGRASYARAMVEIRDDVELRDTIVIVVHKFIGERYTMNTIRVKYECTPPRCSGCKVAKPNRTSKVPTAIKATTSTLNSFEALSTLVDEEERGGNQPLSTNATPIVTRINELERQMLDGKLVLVDDDGKLLKMEVNKSTSIPSTCKAASKMVVDEGECDIEDIYDETAHYMASEGANDQFF
ncbi:hypothetical protein Tco_0459577 [Tanacetum coccineum]